MRLQIKPGYGLTARHFDPEFAVVFAALLVSWPPTGDGFVWITCGREGHEAGLHPQDRAIDVRTRNVVARDETTRVALVRKAIGRLAERLGAGWEIVLEDAHGPNEHAHIELDPKPIPR